MTKNEIVVLSDEQLAILDESFPVGDESENRLALPRFAMKSKDLTEEKGTGKNKTIKVVVPAGTFYSEKDEGEVDEETGKKKWTKDFIEEEEIDAIICFYRKQLKKYDSSLKKWISSSVYDEATQSIPLYLDKQVIKKGTAKELQACYPALTQKGKPTSDLKEYTLLFIFYKGERYQMELSQSSKWAFKDYKNIVNPSKVVTVLGSIEETFGTNTYKKTTFTKKRNLTQEELDQVIEFQRVLEEKVTSDAQYFLENSKADKDFDALPGKVEAPEKF
jgi:hypothetical protein